jgi:hypothetical protein
MSAAGQPFMDKQKLAELIQQARGPTVRLGAYITGGPMGLKQAEAPPGWTGAAILTAVLALGLYVILQMADYYEIRRNWSVYRCQPAISPFAKFYGHDPTETMNFCIGQAVKEHSGEVIKPIYAGINAVGTVVDDIHGVVTSVEGGIMGLLTGFEAFVVNFVNSFRLIGVRIRMSLIGVKEIFQRVYGIFIAFMYSAIAALTFGENLVCNPLTTFIGGLANVDLCCFARGTQIRMADGSVRAIDDLAIGSRLAGGAVVTSFYLFDGAAGCDGMVSIRGVHVSGNHQVRDHDGTWIRADAHPDAVPMPREPQILCLGTTTNTIPVVAPGGGSDLIFTDYEESSDPEVIEAAQASAEIALNRSSAAIGPTVWDYSLGLDPTSLVQMASGSWIPLSTIRIGDRMAGGARVIGLVDELCETVCVLPDGLLVSAAQLVEVQGRWVRAAHHWRTAGAGESMVLMHLLIAGGDGSFMISSGDHEFRVRDYQEWSGSQAVYDDWLKGDRVN